MVSIMGRTRWRKLNASESSWSIAVPARLPEIDSRCICHFTRNLLRSCAKDDGERAHLERVRRDANHDQSSAGCKARQKRPHRLAAWRRCQDCLGTTHLLKDLHRVLRRAVDVSMRAEFSGKFLLVRALDQRAVRPEIDRRERTCWGN
jgi:hypothetical protein